MQDINSLTYDPLTKKIDYSKVQPIKLQFDFSFDDKIDNWLDTLYEDSNLSKKDFFEKVNNKLKVFCQ